MMSIFFLDFIGGMVSLIINSAETQNTRNEQAFNEIGSLQSIYSNSIHSYHHLS